MLCTLSWKFLRPLGRLFGIGFISNGSHLAAKPRGSSVTDHDAEDYDTPEYDPGDRPPPYSLANTHDGLNDFTSVTSSNYALEHLWGRRYSSCSWTPYDGSHRVSEYFLHAVWATLETALFQSPMTPRSVLEVGTHSCYWAKAFANTFLDADILAIDKYPQTEISDAEYPNLTLEVGDIEEPGYLDPGEFDLIIARQLRWINITAFTEEAERSLCPGKWLEFSWVIPTLVKEHPGWDCWKNLCRGIKRDTGKSWMPVDEVEEAMDDAGFMVRMKTQRYGRLPDRLNPQLLFDVRQILWVLHMYCNYDQPEAEALVKQMNSELSNEVECWTFCARKSY